MISFSFVSRELEAKKYLKNGISLEAGGSVQTAIFFLGDQACKNAGLPFL